MEAKKSRPSAGILIAAAGAVLSAILSLPELSEFAPLHAGADLQDILALLDEAMPGRMRSYKIPGLCIGIVRGDRSAIRCYGLAARGGGRAFAPASRFAVASLSKTFTAMAVLCLAAEGRIDLDAPVERFLGGWRFPPGPFDSSRATIRALLSHTAGTNVPAYGGFPAPSADETTLDVLEGRARLGEAVRIVAPPGSGIRYSGGGYMVLQLLIERVSGLAFEDYLRESVFKPLGMGDSSFAWNDARPGDAAAHDAYGLPLRLPRYGKAMAPGGMVTTGDDLSRFIAAFARGRLPLLLGWPEGTWMEFLTPVSGPSGLGFMITRSQGRTLLGHGGTTMGFNAGFTVCPELGAGWFAVQNGNGGVFIESDIDPLLQEWLPGARDPFYRALKMERFASSWLGIFLTGLGAALLASFAVRAARERRKEPGRRHPARRMILRAALAGIALAAYALWILFFHTRLFYPAFTTPWLPASFALVTIGAGCIILRICAALLRPFIPAFLGIKHGCQEICRRTTDPNCR